MPQQTIREVLLSLGIAFAATTVALAQPATLVRTPKTNAIDSWQNAQYRGYSMHELYVVTTNQPDHKEHCHVQSFTEDSLVCSRVFGGSRTYLPQQIAALIVPGDGHARIALFAGLNTVMGAAIWGTVVLTATCPVCAAATAFAALVYFCVAGAVAYADDQPEFLLYLAPGQQLTGKLSKVQQ